MKKAIAISFLFVFLSANTILGQLLHLPTLIHHYLEHVEWDNNPSFIDFLAKHYTQKNDNTGEKHRDHEKLPFKAADYSSATSVSLIPQSVVTVSQIILETNNKKEAIYHQSHSSNAYLNNIWQPPRFC